MSNKYIINTSDNNADVLYLTGTGKVGIGLVTPQSMLDVVGNSDQLLRLRNTENNYVDFKVDNSNNLTINPLSTGSLILKSSTDTNILQIKKSDDSVVFLFDNSTNKLSLGHSSPNATLDILSTQKPLTDTTSAANYQIYARSNNTDIGSSSGIGLGVDDNNTVSSSIIFKTTAADGVGETQIYSKGTGGLTQFMTLADDNKIGIFNNNPTEVLDITGNIKVSGTVYSTNQIDIGKSREDIGMGRTNGENAT